MTKNEITLGEKFFCGAIAGVCSDTCAHPLDTIRARIIMQKKVGTYRYKGLFDAIKSISKNEGFRGFYRGFIPVILGTIPAHGLYFLSYEESKKVLSRMLNRNEQNFFVSILSGLVADIFGSFIWVPMDVLKQNAMVYTEKTQMGVFREIIQREGFKGLYRGYFACLWTFAPYIMLNFGFYEKSKEIQAKMLKRDCKDLPNFCYLTGGVVSSYIASFLTTPFSVGRTRIQCDPNKQGVNIFKEMFSIFKEEGYYSLVEVWKTRSLWFAIGSAITFFTYDSSKKFFLKRKNSMEI